MCGVVGLFTGCPAVAVCPRRALFRPQPGAAPEVEGAGGPGRQADGGGTPPGEPTYQSPFGQWYERAAVRSARPQRLAPDEGRYMFAPELVPIASHPRIRALDEDTYARVMIQHAYRYLDFTATLEHLVVNRTVLGIAHGTIGIDLPEAMRLDAYKIYCDEAYHALFSAELRAQIRTRTGVEPRDEGTPYFLGRLAEIQSTLDPGLAPLAELLFVVCSETLISATLADIPRNPEVPGAVRETIRQHAIDEGRHHAYFAAFLRYLWGRLDPPTRVLAAGLVPRLIMAFLAPDLPALRAELLDYGLCRDEVEQVLAEVYTPEVVADYAGAVSRQTVSHFAAVGALDDASVREGFEACGLLESQKARP